MNSNTSEAFSADNMEFCAPAIVKAAHDAIMEKNYGDKCSVDPSAVVSLVHSLQIRIREAVEQELLIMSVDDVDWETQVFAPIVANFHVVSELGISSEDAEYLVLIGTVITLAYEILLAPSTQEHKSTYTFISIIFAEYLCEPEVHHRVTERLKLEQRRLEAIEATYAIQDAARNLSLMLPDICTSIVAWERLLSKRNVSKSTNPAEITDVNSRPFPRDVHVAVYLRPGQSLPSEFVESINTSSDLVIVQSHFGLRMEIQSGFHVSDIFGMFDAVTLSAQDDEASGRAVLIIVPPGYAYLATKVESVFEVEVQPAKIVIETAQATFEVSHCDYLIKRRNCHNSVLIESTEC